MAGKDLVTQITSDNLESILMDGTPVLVACIRRDKDYQDHLKLLGDVAAPAGSRLNVCVALEDLLPYFSYVYDLKGTPTFLLMHQGMVLDEILGKTSLKNLLEFARLLPSPANHGSTHREKGDSTGEDSTQENAGDSARARDPHPQHKNRHVDRNLPSHQETGTEPDDKMTVGEPCGTGPSRSRARAESHDHCTHTTNKIRGRKRCLKI